MPDELLPDDWSRHCEEDKYCQEIRAALKNSGSLTLREQLLKLLHENPLYGHRGAAALYTLLSRTYWWPKCHKECIKYAKGCEASTLSRISPLNS